MIAIYYTYYRFILALIVIPLNTIVFSIENTFGHYNYSYYA